MAGFAPNVLSSTTSGLFALPAEIRQQIYKYALAPNRHVCFCWSMNHKVAPAPAGPTNQSHATYHERPFVNLLATCRQVHEEANHIVFGMNTMIIPLDVTSSVDQKPNTQYKAF